MGPGNNGTDLPAKLRLSNLIDVRYCLTTAVPVCPLMWSPRRSTDWARSSSAAADPLTAAATGGPTLIVPDPTETDALRRAYGTFPSRGDRSLRGA